MTIAVTGATGQLGRLVIQALKTRVPAGDIIALARSTEKAKDLGVAARAADYTRPDTLTAALRGVDTLLLISATEFGQRVVQHQNAIDAAKAAGVQRIVYTSLLHADRSLLGLAAEHVATEAALKASGVDYTILRNGWYTENYTGSVAGALAGGALLGSAGQGRISSAARADYAEAAAVVLTTPDHAGKTYELAGDSAWTLSDLAAEISRQTGREIPYRDLPVADYAAALAGFGLPQSLAETIAGWDLATSKDTLYDSGKGLSGLIGRPTIPMKDSVSQALNT